MISDDYFEIHDVRLLTYHYLGGVINRPPKAIKLPDDSVELQLCHPTLLEAEHAVPGANDSVLVRFTAGYNCSRVLGLRPFCQYFYIDDHLYRRLTLRDCGSSGPRGLAGEVDDRLIYYLEVEPTPAGSLIPRYRKLQDEIARRLMKGFR